jgi:hypothetical protein
MFIIKTLQPIIDLKFFAITKLIIRGYKKKEKTYFFLKYKLY